MSALKHAAFLGLVSVILLAAAAFGGGGCPPASAAAGAPELEAGLWSAFERGDGTQVVEVKSAN